MEYLTLQNRRCEGDDDRRRASSSRAKDKHVIIIGGGDTGADCLGTAHRQGARSVHQLELLPRRPTRARRTTRGRSGRTSSASRRRTKKAASGSTRSPREQFTGDEQRPRHDAARAPASRWCSSDGRLEFKPVPGSEFELKADLVLLAMGFLGPETRRHARRSSA